MSVLGCGDFGSAGEYPEYSITVGYGPLSAGPGRCTVIDSVMPSRMRM